MADIKNARMDNDTGNTLRELKQNAAMNADSELCWIGVGPTDPKIELL